MFQILHQRLLVFVLVERGAAYPYKENRASVYSVSFDVDTSRNKLRELLNLDPSCAAGCKEPAQKLICAFVDQVYSYVNLMSD